MRTPLRRDEVFDIRSKLTCIDLRPLHDITSREQVIMLCEDCLLFEGLLWDLVGSDLGKKLAFTSPPPPEVPQGWMLRLLREIRAILKQTRPPKMRTLANSEYGGGTWPLRRDEVEAIHNKQWSETVPHAFLDRLFEDWLRFEGWLWDFVKLGATWHGGHDVVFGMLVSQMADRIGNTLKHTRPPKEEDDLLSQELFARWLERISPTERRALKSLLTKIMDCLSEEKDAVPNP